MRQKTAIFLFDGVEVLDCAGPFEVFSVADQLHAHQLFEVYTIAQTRSPIRAINGLSVNPDQALAEAPQPDLLIIPGGDGSRAVIADQEQMAHLQRLQAQATLTMSVCSGARILAQLGLLAGRAYCTHHAVYPDLARMVPDGQPQEQLRFTGSDGLYTAAGISAGIDLSLYVVEQLANQAAAQATARYMEYPYPSTLPFDA